MEDPKKVFKFPDNTTFVRFIGVQFKIEVDDFRTGFPSHVEKFYKDTNPGDFIVFPEDIGLLTAFAGMKAQSSLEAIQALYSKDQRKIDSIAKENEIQNFTTAIFLSLTDLFVRKFYNFFSSLSKEYSVHTLACNNMPRFEKKGENWEFSIARVYNTAFVFGTSGELLFRQDKVFPTAMESDLGISGGDISTVSPFKLDEKKIGIAISLDAFEPVYMSKLEDAYLIIQPDANPGKWNSFLSNGRWQPEEWMDSAYHITQRMERIKNVINPMMVGNLLDIRFEGQSGITKKAEVGDTRMSYIGNLPVTGFHSITGIPGYSLNEYVDRHTLSNQSLDYVEGTVEIEL